MQVRAAATEARAAALLEAEARAAEEMEAAVAVAAEQKARELVCFRRWPA